MKETKEVLGGYSAAASEVAAKAVATEDNEGLERGGEVKRRDWIC